MNQITKTSLKQLGQRIKQARLNRNYTQMELADIIGRSRTAIEGAEKGKCTLETFVSILVALDLAENFVRFLPEQPISPIALAKAQGKQRKRASGIKCKETNAEQTDRLDW
ncbi:MAG: helix-turn-helix transcriptional regulator [Enterobacterales bacterium]|nr:helix-turn-helix transcriptional regulator [Enterobacterales bacterium]